MVISTKGEKRRRSKSFVYRKETFGKRENVVSYASLRTKRREGVFSPMAQKKKSFVHIKAFPIHRWKGKNILQGMYKVP
jgi:hypothetical protein